MQLRSDDRGVTLPEVLVALAILAVIIFPLSDALIGFVRNTDATTRRMSESHDIQLANTYFARDIDNLGVHQWSPPTLVLLASINNASWPLWSCTGPGTPLAGGGLSLAWDDPTNASGPPTVIRVTYLVRDVGGEHQLRRLLCRGSSTVESDLVVVHNLVGTPAPVVVCATATGTAISCTGAGANVPQRVTLTVNIKDPANSGPPTSVTLTGQRRQT
jgi:prepilin-type N-terminal cleavage/methylation domain-containing protein